MFEDTRFEFPAARGEERERGKEGGRQAGDSGEEGGSQLTLPTHPTVVTSLMRRRFVYMNKFMLLSLPIVQIIYYTVCFYCFCNLQIYNNVYF